MFFSRCWEISYFLKATRLFWDPRFRWTFKRCLHSVPRLPSASSESLLRYVDWWRWMDGLYHSIFIWKHVHVLCRLCLKKGYHPTTNDNFNNNCPIPVIFGTNIAKYICQRKRVWYTTSPVYCTYLTLGNFETLKITSSAVKKHLLSYLHFICP